MRLHKFSRNSSVHWVVMLDLSRATAHESLAMLILKWEGQEKHIEIDVDIDSLESTERYADRCLL
jgi:hypothetical protein